MPPSRGRRAEHFARRPATEGSCAADRLHPLAGTSYHQGGGSAALVCWSGRDWRSGFQRSGVFRRRTSASAVERFVMPGESQMPGKSQMPAESDLIIRWRTGDREAFAALLERHQRAVYGFLRARLAQADDAEDMTQEVFLRFYESRTRFDSAALVRPWLLGIARNLLREHVRQVRRRREVGWTELCLELETVLPTDDAEIDEALVWLPTCLGELGPSARQAVELYYRAERKLSEIGVALHRSEGAVKLLLHRARQALRDCLVRKRPGTTSSPGGSTG